MFLKNLHRKLCSKMSGNQKSAPRVLARISSSNTNLLDSTRNGVGAGDPEDLVASALNGLSIPAGAAVQAPMPSERNGDDGRGDSSSGSQTARVILNCTGTEMEDHLDKILECPVCFEVILPPILSCVEGHCWCESCHTALQRCPVCRGEILGVRNLLIEQFLEKCRFKCKFHSLGCPVVLSAKELAIHCRRECPLRPIHCSECNMFVSFDEYLDHLKNQDKIQQHNASECSTGFEIDDNDFYDPPSNGGRRSAVWEPTWLNCYGENFLTFLEYNGSVWWIWVASLTELGCTHRCQTTLWNKEIRSEITFKGRIHPIRSNAYDVLSSGECLILTASTLRKFVYRRGIDVLVRIEREYDPPKTRRGSEVQSPLIAVRGTTAGGNRSTGTSAQPTAAATRAAPGAAIESRNQNSNSQRSSARSRGTISSSIRRRGLGNPFAVEAHESGFDRGRPSVQRVIRRRQNQQRLSSASPGGSHRNTRRSLVPRAAFGYQTASVMMSSITSREVPVAEEEDDNSEDMEAAEMDGEYDDDADIDGGADIDDDDEIPLQ